MKEIRIFLASSYELEPDRARIGNLIRRLNDKYEARHIYLKLEKWEDVESFYNGGSKQGEYDHLIRRSRLFVGLFWHCAGMYTVHEVDVARANLPPENVLIFRKTAPFREDHEGSEDVKRFRERFPEKELFKSEAEMDDYLAKQETVFRYETFPELGDVLSKKIEEYCASVTVTEEEKARTYSRNTLQIHVAASPEVEPDVARLGDLVRYLDENSRHYCRIRMIDALPGSDMFVSMCHTSAPDEVRNEIDAAVRANGDPANNGRPRLFFCMKYLESGTPKDPSLEELEKQFGSVLSHYPDQYAHAPELKLHFMLQLERLQKERAHSDAMLVVKDGVIYQKNGETESPVMSCEDMGSLQKDEAYGEMKQHLSELRAELEELKERDRNSKQDLSKEIHRLYQEITEVEERIRDKQNGYLRLARTLEEMVGQEQDEMILRVRELFRDGKVDEALKLLPAPDDQWREWEELERRIEKERMRAHQICKLTIDCLRAGNRIKNRDKVFNLYELLIKISDSLQSEEKKGDACFEYACCLMSFCFYDKALEYYEKTLAIRLRILGEDHQDVARTCNNIGVVWINKGNYDKALEYHNTALSILLRILGKDHQDVAACCNNIGVAWNKKGNHDKALEYYEKALAIQLRVLGKDHQDVARTYNNIGNVWNKKKVYPKALEYYRKNLEILLRIFGEKHPNVAICHRNIGSLLSESGHLQDALEHCKKCLTVLMEQFGEDHHGVAETFFDIGHILRDMKCDDAALDAYDKALTIWTHLFGENHPAVADSLFNIGIVRSCGKKDFDEGLAAFEKCLKIRSGIFGEHHPAVVGCCHCIGIVWNQKGNYWKGKGDKDKALECYEKALSFCLRAFGENHPDVARCYGSIGECYCEEENYDKALYYYKNALSSCRHAFGEEHPIVAAYYYNIGGIFTKMDDPDDANVTKNIYGKEKTLKDLGHQKEAKECFAKARAIAQNFPGNAFCRMILEELSGEDE